MARRTAKTAQEAIDWINTTPHHRGRWEHYPNSGWPPKPKAFILGNYRDELRIPLAIHEQIKYTSVGRETGRVYDAAPKHT